MKQDDLSRSEIERIEAIHDLTTEVHNLNTNLVEVTHALLDSIAKLNHVQLQVSSNSFSGPTVPPLNLNEAIFPDFAAWRRDAIKTKNGLVFAPSDLYISNKDGVRRYLFTWDEAMQIEQQILRPCGWRLPTGKEWIMMVNEYRDNDRLVNDLKLAANGFALHDAMQEYHKHHDDSSVILRGSCGHYWSSTAYGTSYAYYLHFNSDDAQLGLGINYINKYHGCTVRCVKDT